MFFSNILKYVLDSGFVIEFTSLHSHDQKSQNQKQPQISEKRTHQLDFQMRSISSSGLLPHFFCRILCKFFGSVLHINDNILQHCVYLYSYRYPPDIYSDGIMFSFNVIASFTCQECRKPGVECSAGCLVLQAHCQSRGPDLPSAKTAQA